MLSPQKYLRGTIGKSAILVRTCLTLDKHFGESTIDELRDHLQLTVLVSLMSDHDVFELQVSMRDPIFVQEIYPTEDAAHQSLDDPLVSRFLFDVIQQVQAIDQLLYDINLLAVFEDLQQKAHMFGILAHP